MQALRSATTNVLTSVEPTDGVVIKPAIKGFSSILPRISDGSWQNSVIMLNDGTFVMTPPDAKIKKGKTTAPTPRDCVPCSWAS